MPKALITGGAGFIGRHLVRLLSAEGWSVTVLDPKPFEDAPSGISRIASSVLDGAALGAALADTEAVFHLAAQAELWVPDPAVYEAINVEGTRAVLAAARAVGVGRFVHVSSETTRHAVTGRCDGGVVAIDDLAGPYSRSKRQAEELVLAAAADGFPALVLSPTVPIGPGDIHLTPPTRMLADFLCGRTPAFFDAEMNFVDVRDVARALAAAVSRGETCARYIIAGENVRLSTLLRLLEELTGRPMPRRTVPWGFAWCVAVAGEAVARLTGRPPRASLEGVRLARSPLLADGAPAARIFGLKPTPLATSLADAVAWLADAGHVAIPPQGS